MNSRDALILRLLAPAPLSGRDLRAALARQGFWLSLATFYMAMSRLADEGYVTAWDVDKDVEGETIKERWYRH